MGILPGAWVRIFPLFAALVAAATSLSAQGQDAFPVGAGPADRRELEAFFDELLSGLMADRHVPGAVVLVVKDGAVFFSKGYGVADLATGRPVDPDTTLFRVASISKLFTATAVMQLVEQGKLDLNVDVNQYLEDFRLPDAFGKPVTLANLLTHTGGFDDSSLGMSQPLGAVPIRLETYLAARMPRRVMPPGELLSYSNHGLALAGYLVERASGQPFAEYMREHVLDPLGMTHSGFGLPAPPPSSLAVGYDWKGDHYEPMGYDHSLIAPAGDLYTSAGEIARFMLAQLQGGKLGEVHLLGEETTRKMQATHFTHHPKLTGWCYGFAEGEYNGVRTVEHAGDWRGFGSQLVLLPESGLGIFISTTRDYDFRFFDPLWRSFFDRWFPRAVALPAASPPADFATRAARYTGAYIPNRHVRSDFLKLGLFLAEGSVSANPDGTLTVVWPGMDRDPSRLWEVGPELFAIEGLGHFVAFRGDRDGHSEHLIADAWVFDWIPWYQRPRMHALVGAACSLLFLATIVAIPFGVLLRRLAGEPRSGMPVAARSLAIVVASLELCFLAGIGAGFATVNPYSLNEAIPLWLTASSLIPLVALPLSLGLPYFWVRSFMTHTWTAFEQLHYLALTLAAGFFGVFVWYWNLLGIIR